jgi:hypothetical protein
MFNLTTVGLSMCVKVYSDLFLSLMIEYEPILAFMSLQGNYLAWQEKFVKVPAWWKKFEKIPAWQGKVGIILMLIYPAWREKVVMTHMLLVYPAQGEKFSVALMLS